MTRGLGSGARVTHPRFGVGTVEFAKAETAIVRFEHGLEECPTSLLALERDLSAAIAAGRGDPPLDVLTRIQAEAILSINDAWGVFSPSRIALLPHQLWVCHKVTRSWPFTWLVADDVGLGKTVEAGLILWPLLAKGLVRRFMILCPASLVEQWQFRLRDMFDIRLSRYLVQADTPRADFWNAHDQVVASLQTLRDDHKGRHQRLFEARPWDLLIVDEAHHLNLREDTGATLGYRLVESLVQRDLVTSKLFFTGTPHRGKDYSFFGLLQLLRPDLFSPKAPPDEQIPNLRRVIIRNNKQNVTDMQGRKLFKPVSVFPETYRYSPEEAAFYDLLTEFIATGRAYASSLTSERDQQAVMLVLITMQKLASSSVAAIRKALQGRIARVRRKRDNVRRAEETVERIRDLMARLQEGEQPDLLEELQKWEERLAEESVELQLMEDEVPQLEILLNAAEAVRRETKIARLLELVEERYAGRRILFFTEYKATQALVMSALMQRFGDDCVTFINGDNRIDGVVGADGRVRSLTVDRLAVAERFNRGRVRFLVSTEAAGEGVDLQEACHTLIHVDLPWNPMRLHQRVGRLNRYGQKRPVEVVTLRNPETVESHIWDKLNAKLHTIMTALGAAMDEPEDLLQLVLGMTSPTLFTEIFAEAPTVPPDSLATWFDAKTKTLGGRHVLDTVRNLVGNTSRFDYGALTDIPPLDLDALRPFFETMLQRNGRRVTWKEDGLAFKTPEPWLVDPGVRPRYLGLHFSRELKGRNASTRIVGVGHRAFDQALLQARRQTALLTTVKGLAAPIGIFKVFDRVTGHAGAVKQLVFGVQAETNDGMPTILRDWQLLEIINGLVKNKQVPATAGLCCPTGDTIEPLLRSMKRRMERYISEECRHPFEIPAVEPLALLWNE